MDKPEEFEIRDYDTSTRETPRQQTIQEPPEEKQGDPPTNQEEPSTSIQEPEIIQETTPEEQTAKVPRMLRNLNSGLDGNKWGCSQTHRPRLRVRTTGLEEGKEYQDS